MHPPVFETCSIDAGVQSQIGDPCRLYEFGEAPQGVTLPYVVWQTISGSPENYLDCAPDIDSWSFQMDVYALSASSARDVARALRDAIEPIAHVVSWNGEDRDPQTKHFHYSFSVDWWVSR